MASIEKFVSEARAKGLDDADIKEALQDQGWSKAEVTMALTGIKVPSPDKNTSSKPKHNNNLHPLLAALQHVLLWFFIAASSVSIAAVVSSLTGDAVSSTALATLLSVTVITFTPYAIFFILYLRRLKHDPNLTPGNIWSIITVCLHSLGALVAAIVLTVALITNGELSTIISSAIILALYSIVVATYSLAAFAKPTQIRKIVLIASLPILAIIMGSLFTLSLMQIGPSLQDQKTRDNLVLTTQSIAEFAADNNRIPDNDEASNLIKGQSIKYQKQTDTTYQLCATFSSVSSSDETYFLYEPTITLSDAYPHESQFINNKTGEHCFSIQSSYLTLDTSDFKN